MRVPVLTVEGPYGAFARAETALLGLLCQASGIATAAARVRRAAGDRTALSFGVRRVHPAIAVVVDRATYLGGCDGVSSAAGAEAIGVAPQGTMPNALVLTLGGIVPAMIAFDKHVDPDVPRIALVDTLEDERMEAVRAAEALGDRLAGVRLDTVGSRRGSLAAIVQEVRWELDRRGFQHVKILASGGIGEADIPELAEAGVDGFGVGTYLSDAATVNFALDIVEVDGGAMAKRGKFPGRKVAHRCSEVFIDRCVMPGETPACPQCNADMTPLAVEAVKGGRVLLEWTVVDARDRVMGQLARLREPRRGDREAFNRGVAVGP